MKIIALLYSFFSLVNVVQAHPHMFVDVQPYLQEVDKNKGEVRVRNKWYFDEFTSEGLYMDYDQNQNKRLDKKEIEQIKNDFESGLKKYKYFLNIKLNGKKIRPKVQSFKIKTEKRRKKEQSINDIIAGTKKKKDATVNIIYYEFDIIIPGKLAKNNKMVISYYDETLYSVLYPKEKMIAQNNIKLSSNKLTKSKCLFEVGFSI